MAMIGGLELGSDERIEILPSNRMRIVKTTVLREGDANDVYDQIVESAPMETPLLPMGESGGTLAYAQNGTIKIFWVQRPECLVNVEATGKVYTMAWPWALYGVIVERFLPLAACMFWTKGRLQHRSDDVYHTGLPNVMPSERLCMGGGFINSMAGATSYDAVIRRTIHWVHTASFNNHIEGQAITRVPQEIVAKGTGSMRGHKHIFERWAKWTADEGDQWRKVNHLTWRKANDFDSIKKGFKS